MGVVIRFVVLAVVAWLVARGLRAVLAEARQANMPARPTPSPTPGGARRPEALAMQPCPRCGTFLPEDQRPTPTRACPACGGRPPAA